MSTQTTSELLKKSDPRYIDHLDEDPPMADQRWACVSYVAPGANQKAGVAGFKWRRACRSEEEARTFVKRIQMFDSDFDVFICQMGTWTAFNPDPEQIEDEEFAEERLNQLVKEQKQQRILAKQHFNERKRNLMEQAMKEGTQEAQVAKNDEKEHLIALRSRMESTDAELAELKTKMTELLKQKKSDMNKIGDYTEEEIREANEIEKKARGGEATEIDNIQASLDNDAILTHSQRQSMKASGELPEGEEEYEVHDYSKGQVQSEEEIKKLEEELVQKRKEKVI